MAEEFNNINQSDTSSKATDEVVDEIPQNARNINENRANTNTQKSSGDNSLMGIISLVLGIFSIICCCTFMPAVISAVIGLVLGIISLKSKNNDNNVFSIIGIILCSVGIAIFLFTMASFIIFGSINSTFEVPATMHQMTM